MTRTDNPLLDLPFFQQLSPTTTEQLWRCGQIRSCPRKSILIHSGDPLQAIYFQLTGKSFLYTMAHTGQRKIHFICGTGTLLNQNTLPGSLASSYCEMLESSQIFCIPVDAFMRCIQQDFNLAIALIGAQELKIWRLEHQMKNTISSLYMERKLAAKLWKLARDFGVETDTGIEIDINFPVNFLADMLGVPRETASRLRSALVGYGLIAVDKKRITVVNPDRMAYFYRHAALPEDKTKN